MSAPNLMAIQPVFANDNQDHNSGLDSSSVDYECFSKVSNIC